MMRRASASTASIRVASRTTTANSSPPSRPQTVEASINCASRADTRASRRSPIGWPSVSLTALNRSRSIIMKLQRWPLRSASAIAWASVSLIIRRLGRPVSVSKPRHPGDAIGAHTLFGDVGPDAAETAEAALFVESRAGRDLPPRCSPFTSTGMRRSRKLSRAFILAASSRSASEKWPVSHAGPARTRRKDWPLIAMGSRPQA